MGGGKYLERGERYENKRGKKRKGGEKRGETRYRKENVEGNLRGGGRKREKKMTQRGKRGETEGKLVWKKKIRGKYKEKEEKEEEKRKKKRGNIL